MKFQVLIFKHRHQNRHQSIERALKILLEYPGLTPTAFAVKMWPKLEGHRQAGQQGSSYLRRLKNKGYVKIRYKKLDPPYARYRPVMQYFLTNAGFEIVNILTGRERTKEETQQIEDREGRPGDRGNPGRSRRSDAGELAQRAGD